MISEGGLMGSASALQRMRSRLGLRAAGSTAPSVYIAMCKLRKVLVARLTDDVSLDGDTHRLLKRIDRLPPDTIRALFLRLDTHGEESMLKELSQPMVKLMRTNYTSTIK